MSNATFVYISYIATTAERLWEALTDGAFTRAYWYDRRIVSSWVVGEPMVFYDGGSDTVTDEGVVLAYDPPRHLAYTFRYMGQDAATEASRVSFMLEAHGGLVKLTLVHDQLPNQQAADGFREGWSPILSSLKTLLETGTPLLRLSEFAQKARAGA